MKPSKSNDSAQIPSGKLSRMSKLGGLASRIAGNMLAEGISELAKGNRPKVKDLLLTPDNMLKVADQLAKMRGAAMKVGQLLSMDAGELLPAELSDILSRLRKEAKSMPQKDLQALLNKQWGDKWQQNFIQFPMQPIAAASIGQVHKVITKDLRRLAIKLQYPGIKESINSDVDNVATLIKMSGLLPKNLDIAPLLEEAKLQLHDEADYNLEAKRIEQYQALVKDDEDFIMPDVYAPLSSDAILAMTYLDGDPIESLVDSPQELRDQVISSLFKLFFRELFDFGLMQTDPNFANYLFDSETGKIVLLDFGATRQFNASLTQGYLQLMKAAKKQDREQVHQAALTIGLMSTQLASSTQKTIVNMCMHACEPLYLPTPYDFGKTDLAQRLQQLSMNMGMEKAYAHTPPTDCIFLHRKLAGLFLLAIKLKARVNFEHLFQPYQHSKIQTNSQQ